MGVELGRLDEHEDAKTRRKGRLKGRPCRPYGLDHLCD